MTYTTRVLPLSKLVLDPKNPRFVVIPNPDEISIMHYLIKHEGVLALAKGINEDKGLLPGERIIVTYEDGKYIVLEGNRRICACKLLLGLLETDRKIDFVTEITKNNLIEINVDFVENRKSVQSALYKRHLVGVKSWSPQAKQFFFAMRFLNGESIESISTDIAKESVVRKAIQEYNLLSYTLELPSWKADERLKLDSNTLEIDKFLRVFNSKSKPRYQATVKTLLNISFNELTMKPESSYGRKVLDKALYTLARAAFVTGQLSTRKSAEDIPEFVSLIEKIKKSDGIIEDLELKTLEESKEELTNNNNTPYEEAVGIINNMCDNKKSDQSISTNLKFEIPPMSSPKAFMFFEALTWHALNSKDPEDLGLMYIAQEIMKISKYKHFGWYPISTTILLRALLEQTLKFHIKKMDLWLELVKNNQGKDPTLSQIIKFYKDNKRYVSLFGGEKKYYSAFLNAVSDENIIFMDTVVHSTETILPSREKLDSIAKSGMFTLIHYILNEKKHWPIT